MSASLAIRVSLNKRHVIDTAVCLHVLSFRSQQSPLLQLSHTQSVGLQLQSGDLLIENGFQPLNTSHLFECTATFPGGSAVVLARYEVALAPQAASGGTRVATVLS